MVSITLKERDLATTVKRLSVTLDFQVMISGITQERVRHSHLWDEDDRGFIWEQAERQQRLLRALLRDEQALHRYLVYVVTSDPGTELGSKLTKPEVMESEEILKPVYTGMREEDARTPAPKPDFTIRPRDASADAPSGNLIKCAPAAPTPPRVRARANSNSLNSATSPRPSRNGNGQ